MWIVYCCIVALEVEEFHVGEMRCPVCCFGCCDEEVAFECECVYEGGEWAKVLFDVLLPEWRVLVCVWSCCAEIEDG